MSKELLEEVKAILEKETVGIEIDLSNEGLNDDDISEIVKLLKRYSEKEIKHLKLYRNNISDEGAKLLSTLSNVRSINLSLNRIGDESVRLLVANPKIQKLNLTDNPITDDCAEFIVENTKQVYLALERTKIQDENLLKIQEAVKRNELKINYLKEDESLHKKSQEMGVLGVFKSPDLVSPKTIGKEKKETSPMNISPTDTSPRQDDISPVKTVHTLPGTGKVLK